LPHGRVDSVDREVGWRSTRKLKLDHHRNKLILDEEYFVV